MPIAWITLSLLAVTGCESSGVLLVDLKTDMRAPSEITHARVRIRPSAPGSSEIEQWTDLPATLDIEPIRLIEQPSLPHGDLEVSVDLYDGATRVAGRVVFVSGYRGEIRAVTVLVSRSCRGFSCPPRDAPAATECLGARCVEPSCTPETPELCPDPECGVELACPSAGECYEGRCVDGICFSVPRDERCPSGMVCDYEGGCAAPIEADAGPHLDGGTGPRLDGGMDAGPGLDAGARVDGGTDAGIDAGPGCVPADCSDANPCTDDVCGAGGCTNPPNAAACDDGVYCNGSDTCSAGTCSRHPGNPCSGAAVCDEGADACVGCLGAADCGGPVVTPWSPCGGFSSACDTTGTQSQTTTTYACLSGACVGTDTPATRACTRPTEGVSCGSGGLRCCSEVCVSTATDVGSCGGCGVVCARAHAAESCVGSTCNLGACETGWGNCNAVAWDGCEASLTSIANCGACRVACATNEACNTSGACACGSTTGTRGGGPACVDALDHATGRCRTTSPRSCGVATCDAGYDDCNGTAWDGCEVTLATNETHCGACGNACGAGEVCSGGRCTCGTQTAPSGPACSAGQACRSCGCVPATETSCYTGSPDEDCDGLLNCADPDCDFMVCRIVGGTRQCEGGLCVCECPGCADPC